MSRNFNFLRYFLASVLAVLTMLSATASAQSDPARAAVESFLAAQHKGDWKAFVGHFDPQDISKFRADFGKNYGGMIPQMDTTVLRPSYFGVKSLGEIASVDSITYVAAIFRTILDVMPPLRDMMMTAKETILGSVDEGADTKHFVMRVKVTVQNEALSNIEVVSVRKVGSQWRIVGKRNMEQMANLLKRIIR